MDQWRTSLPLYSGDATARKRIAILLFDGVEMIDYAGPYEVFAGDQSHLDLYTVSPTDAAVTTGMGGLKVLLTSPLPSSPGVRPGDPWSGQGKCSLWPRTRPRQSAGQGLLDLL